MDTATVMELIPTPAPTWSAAPCGAVEHSRGKRESKLWWSPEGSATKRPAHEALLESQHKHLGAESKSSKLEQKPVATAGCPSRGSNGSSRGYHQHQPTSIIPVESNKPLISSSRAPSAPELAAVHPVYYRRMERPSHTQRTPEEVELALEVLNDELAGASPLDRPSLELATQALTERLVQMRKEQQQQTASIVPTSSSINRQSTFEYTKSLQAVIVGEGSQKYTLIRIPKQDDMVGDVYLVRGDPKAEYHYQTALETLNSLQSRNIMSDVTGGGRMDVLKDDRKVQIYGYSYQYGAADHSITAKMMKEHLGDEFLVSFGNYGY
ncbi:uncharacterized protein LOC34619793 [Cyclospora cayetanensis]|uniref:Uncharacterized protein LOC34619793 n=1 Tax=Cyclospora cayetanensis TaxID=88456 RepID=A0A6P6RX62_9EIME|nr:uncharacterized protein LOC34619793 [Cyclospora cayetanensis]